MFTRQGYDETSIADIAAHAGIGHGTVYRYFSSKRELLDHVFDHAVERAVSALRAVGSAGPPADYQGALDLVQTIGGRLFDLIDEEPGLVRLLTIQGGAVDPELRDRVIGLLAMTDAALSRIFDTITPPDQVHDWTQVGRLVIGLTGPGLDMALTGVTDRARRDQVLKTARTMIDRGVLVPDEDGAT